MFDYLGKEITVGSYIIYTRIIGSSPYLTTAKVIEIKDKKLKCLSVDYGYYEDKVTGKPEVGYHLMKAINLNYPNRVIVINREQLSKEVLDVLG